MARKKISSNREESLRQGELTASEPVFFPEYPIYGADAADSGSAGSGPTVIYIAFSGCSKQTWNWLL
jgi:hypothetical protein